MQLAFGRRGRFKPAGSPRLVPELLPRGIVSALGFTDGRFTDLVTGNRYIPRWETAGGSGYKPFAPTAYGLAYPWFFPHLARVVSGFSPRGVIELICVTGNGAPGNFDYVFRGDQGTGWQKIVVSAGKWQFSVYNGSSYITVTDTASIAAGTYYHLVGVSDGANIQFYINGVLIGSAVCAAATPVGGLNLSDASGDQSAKLSVLFAAFADGTPWTASEVAARYLDPYSFLVFPDDELDALLVGSAAGATLVVADGTIALASDVATVSQVQILAPADGTVALASDVATVSQIQVLAPADGTIALASDGATVSQIQVLAPADGTIALASDVATVAIAGALAPADGTIALAADGATVSQVQILAPADGTIALASDGVTVGQVHIIGPADAAVAIASDLATVAQAQILVANDAAVALASDVAAVVLFNAAPSSRRRLDARHGSRAINAAHAARRTAT